MAPWEQFQNDWNGKRVLIMGLGIQGRGVGDAKVFAEAGAEVTVTDLKNEDELRSSLLKLSAYNIRFVLRKHDEADFKDADVIIRNPAVPRESPYLKIACEHGVPIKMDSSLFARYCPLPIVGITGTRGKTTATMMIHEIIEKGQTFKGLTFLGGNVPGRATLELLQIVEKSRKRYKKVDGSDLSGRSDPANTSGIVVLELSSWELEGWNDEKISPHIAVFTNFSEDHLNRYTSMEEYFLGKLPITSHQSPSDWFIVHRDNEWTRRAVRMSKAQIKWFSSRDIPSDLNLLVPGEHNRTNAAAALAVADILGIDHEDALGVLRNFRGVPGRLETIAVIDGVTYVNDTTATTPTATIAALRAIDKPIVLIAGGSSKKLDLRPLVRELVEKAKHVVFLKGEGSDEMRLVVATLPLPIRRRLLARDDVQAFGDLKEAVEQAKALARPGDVVLLSPGCASFSVFKNEFDRGEQFNQIVRTWQKRR